MSAPIFVDDRDPSIIYNALHWGFDNNAQEFDGTNTFCNLGGGTVTYHFSGPASISVYGVIQPTSFADHAPGRFTYSIDNGALLTYNPGAQTDSTQFNVQLFESTVSSGSHTLVITTLDPGKYVYVDFILIVPHSDPSIPSTTTNIPPPTTSQQAVSPTHTLTPVTTPDSSGQVGASFTSAPVSSTSANPALSSPSSIPSSARTDTLDLSSLPSGMVTVTRTLPGTTVTGGAVPDTTTAANSDPLVPTSHHSSLGAIVGSIIGGLIFVALLLWILYFVKKKRQNSGALSPSSRQQVVSPFVLAEVDAAPPRYSNVYSKDEETPEPPPMVRSTGTR